MIEPFLIRFRRRASPRSRKRNVDQIFFDLSKLTYAEFSYGSLVLHSERHSIDVAAEDVDRVLDELERIGGANAQESLVFKATEKSVR